MKPRLSVVIPAYNARETLRETLRALMDQTLPKDDYEVIVVDDGSTDSTARVAAEFNVRVVSRNNKGPAAARNHGASLAEGEKIFFTDSDCVPAADWLEKMEKALADGEVAGVQGVYKTRQTSLTARFAQAEFEERYAYMARHEHIDLAATYAAGFSREVFNRMGGFDETFPVANNEDTEFSYRLVEAGYKLKLAPEAVVYHRHPSHPIAYLRTKFLRAYWRMIVYRRYPDKVLRDRYTTSTVKVQTLAMLVSFVLLLLTPWLKGALPILSFLWLGIMSLSVPMARRFFHSHRALALTAPFFVLARSMVFAGGTLMGALACLGPSRRPIEKKKGRHI